VQVQAEVVGQDLALEDVAHQFLVAFRQDQGVVACLFANHSSRNDEPVLGCFAPT
jgi:hypothetical protein